MTVLIIVESNKKAQKITKFLSNEKTTYICTASYGHIIDLKKTEMSIDFSNWTGIYENINQKSINNIKELSKNCEYILLASDDDDEGHFIAKSISDIISNKIKNNPNRLEIYRLIPEMVGKKSFEGSVLRQIEELNELLEQKDDLLREVTNENIQVVIINERLKNRISSIKNSIQVIEERLLNEKNIINKKLNEIEATYFGLPEKKMEYQRLKYIEELNNRYFSIFTEKKIEYELSNAGYTTSNRILKTAKLSDTPVSPNKKLIYGILCSLGFLIGLSLLILRYLTYNDIISMQDLEKILPSGINLLGAAFYVK